MIRRCLGIENVFYNLIYTLAHVRKKMLMVKMDFL